MQCINCFSKDKFGDIYIYIFLKRKLVNLQIEWNIIVVIFLNMQLLSAKIDIYLKYFYFVFVEYNFKRFILLFCFVSLQSYTLRHSLKICHTCDNALLIAFKARIKKR